MQSILHSPPFFYPGHVGPAPLLAFFAGTGLLGLSLILARRMVGSRIGAGKRDMRSTIGVFVQSIGCMLASGPVAIANEPWIDGLASWRTVVVALLMLITLGLFRWSTIAMGRNWAIIAQLRSDHRLVTDGPFGYVRNPIYVSLLVFLIALALATGHEAALIIAIPIYLIGTAIRIRREEALLRAQFGAVYDAYAGTVKRLIPGII